MQKMFQAVAWVLAGAIVVLSLSPPSVRPATDAASGLEHFLILLATGHWHLDSAIHVEPGY